MKLGGILIFDDELQTPHIAIDAFLTVYRTQYELLHMAGQVIVKKLS